MVIDDLVAGETQADDAGTDTSSAVSAAGGRFVKGHDPRRNLAGRIKKKPTVLDETQKLAERKRKQLAAAHVNRMLKEDATGNRAWADYRDTFHGVPKQTLVLEQGDAPADQLYTDLQALLSGQTVEGSARLITDTENTET